MNQYIVNLNCRVDAKTEEEARTKALENLQIEEASPLVLLPLNVFEYLKEYRDKPKEYFIALTLSTQNQIIGKEIISVGTLNSSIVHCRETFRKAIQENASHILVCHNHPSGNLQPSQEDLLVTKRLKEAGKILGLEVVDHVIITKDNFFSFREHNLM